MGFINLAEKTVQAKLVYYGIGMGGKTTSLQAVHSVLCPANEVKLVSINTEEDATLLFDFLPINLGIVEGFQIKIQGFTVPGQPKYKLMRKYVLQGADAVVLVVDSQRSRLEENIQALEGLQDNLRLNGIDPQTIPIVMQYNKRDLDDLLTSEELDEHFVYREGIQAFPSVATTKQGTFETFVHAAGLLVEAKVSLYGLGQGDVDPKSVAEGARRRLWEVHDEIRGRNMELVDQGVHTPVERPAVDQESTEDDDRISLSDADLELNPAEPRRLELTFTDGEERAELEPDRADELREATSGPEVFSDEELDMDLALEQVEEPDYENPQELIEDDSGLLDHAVQSNVQLAQAFGDLEQFKNALQQKNEELVKVAQNTVHDLNRPLSAIKLMLSSAGKGLLGEMNQTLTAAVENSLLAVRQMERLLGDLMDSSRLDFDGIQMQFENVDMHLLVADVVRTLKNEIHEKDVGIRLEPLPTMCVDEWSLTKAFFNLIGNAIQYSSPDRPPRVRIYEEKSDEFVVIHVEDNGIGIPETSREKLFRRFERGENTGGISGTGLGLHIVKEVVQGHGGYVEVHSTLGEGTRFSLYLPKEPVQAPHSVVSG